MKIFTENKSMITQMINIAKNIICPRSFHGVFFRCVTSYQMLNKPLGISLNVSEMILIIRFRHGRCAEEKAGCYLT